MKKIFMLLIFCSIFLVACGKNDNSKLVNSNEKIKFVSKCTTIERNDGWFYYFCIEPMKKDISTDNVKDNYELNEYTNYVFDGVNLKHNSLENYYIPIYDQNNNEIDKTEAPYPTLSISTLYRDEIKIINDFFNKKKFANEIKESDLNELNLTYFDKKVLINMFNSAYLSEPIELGKYINLPFVEIVSSISENGYRFQVGYYVQYGTINKIDIEVLYDNGTYLSDIIADENASMEQQQLFQKISNIEKYVIQEQSFNISNSDSYDNSLKKLSSVMKRIIERNE